MAVLSGASFAHAAQQAETFNLQAAQGGGTATRALAAPAGATNISAVAQQAGFTVTITGAGATCSASGGSVSCSLSGASALSLRVTNTRPCGLFGLVCANETTAVTATWTTQSLPPQPDLTARVAVLENQLTAVVAANSVLQAQVAGVVASNASLQEELSEINDPLASRVLAQGGLAMFDDGELRRTGDVGKYVGTWSQPTDTVSVPHWRIQIPGVELGMSDTVIAVSESIYRYCRGSADIWTGDAIILCYNSFGGNEQPSTPTEVKFVIFSQK
jgi:hypothetical protein